MVLGKLAIYMQKTEIRSLSLTLYKNHSKWIKDLKVRSETSNLLQENLWKTLADLGIGNYFLNRTPVVQEIRARIDKWDCIKLKSFCSPGTVAKTCNPSYLGGGDWED
jgi:hypothetical protein